MEKGTANELENGILQGNGLGFGALCTKSLYLNPLSLLGAYNLWKATQQLSIASENYEVVWVELETVLGEGFRVLE